ncbi:hypothetical protein Daura_22380 [Dactylosporangium aurantiacum]|uniref:Uncharacterized protein n=1 Tax=Dactylosporangium aurantiacum TaxID=35754 RepID=A0A9Q9IN30_9ACTN|nr:hypothetical protein [Dactylosporangium aurantiacum]MDG6110436.1 hypothetical protein [Dactylosporangium aurantiacum]UWZ58671.1 hypothetical protein Daura_22380 [Dactylosporangium aurantiacum]
MVDDRRTVPVHMERFALRASVGWLGVLAGGVGFLALLLVVRSDWQPMQSLDQAVADGLNTVVADDGLLQKFCAL